MKKLLYILTTIFITGCMVNKEPAYYQITLSINGTKPDDILSKPMYQKKDNQCGALFLEDRNLTVINSFDTSLTFINLKYQFEKNQEGVYDTYSFEDVFLKKKKGRYTIVSSLRNDLPVLEIKNKKIKLLDKSAQIIQNQDGSTIYLYKCKNVKHGEFTEMYTIKRTQLTEVIYDQYSFPCK